MIFNFFSQSSPWTLVFNLFMQIGYSMWLSSRVKNNHQPGSLELIPAIALFSWTHWHFWSRSEIHGFPFFYGAICIPSLVFLFGACLICTRTIKCVNGGLYINESHWLSKFCQIHSSTSICAISWSAVIGLLVYPIVVGVFGAIVYIFSTVVALIVSFVTGDNVWYIMESILDSSGVPKLKKPWRGPGVIILPLLALWLMFMVLNANRAVTDFALGALSILALSFAICAISALIAQNIANDSTVDLEDDEYLYEPNGEFSYVALNQRQLKREYKAKSFWQCLKSPVEVAMLLAAISKRRFCPSIRPVTEDEFEKLEPKDV